MIMFSHGKRAVTDAHLLPVLHRCVYDLNSLTAFSFMTSDGSIGLPFLPRFLLTYRGQAIQHDERYCCLCQIHSFPNSKHTTAQPSGLA